MQMRWNSFEHTVRKWANQSTDVLVLTLASSDAFVTAIHVAQRNMSRKSVESGRRDRANNKPAHTERYLRHERFSQRQLLRPSSRAQMHWPFLRGISLLLVIM